MIDPLAAFPEDDPPDIPRPFEVSDGARQSTLGSLSAFPDDDGPDRLKVALSNGQQTSPDQAAKVFKLRLQTGLPAETITRNLAEVERQVTTHGFNAETFRRESPKLAGWLQADPQHAALTHDDLVPLTAMERILGVGRNLAGALGAGVAGFSQGIWGSIQAAAETGLIDALAKVDDSAAMMADSEGHVPPPVTGRLTPGAQLADFAAGTAKVAERLAERARGPQTGAGFVERGIYGGVESVGQMAPGIALGFITGGTGALLTAAGITTGGQSYTQARAQGVDVGKAAGFGALQGAIEVATEYIPAHRLLGDVAAKAPLWKMLMRQVAAEVPGEEVATILQDLNEWAVLPVNKDRTFVDYLNERPSQAAATLISTITAVGATTIAAHGTAHVLEQLGTVAAESKTLKRSPEAVEAFLAQATKGSPLETVYAPIDTWATYWQSKGLDPEAVATDLTGDPTAYRTAVSLNQDLSIPTAAYAVKLASTEHNAFLSKELRLKPDEMNVREAEAFEAEQMAAIPTEPPAPTPLDTATQTITDRLVGAGMPAETAQTYGALWRAGLGTVAEKAGIDPQAILALYGAGGPTITRPALGTAPAAPAEAGTAPLAPVVKKAATPEERILELETELRDVKRTAETDPLTGIANRAALDKALPAAEADPDTAVVAFDANNFGQVNKQLGHEAGDAMLKGMATAIKQAATEAGVGERVFRRGGDEFVVLAPTDVADQVRTRAEALFGSKPAGTAQVSLSGNLGSTFAAADATLQAAKQARKEALIVAAEEARQPRPESVSSEGLNVSATPEAGEGLPNRSDQPPGPAQEGVFEAGGDRRGLGDRGVSTTRPGGDPDELFVRQPPAVNAARLTPDVRQEVERIKDELETFPNVERTWNWLGEGAKTGNAAGGAADVVAGTAGAPVYGDVLYLAPQNKGTKGRAVAKQVRGTRGQVVAAARTILETNDVKTNLAEGVLRVAERRAAGEWKDLSKASLPPTWNTEVPPAGFVEDLTTAADDAVDLGGDASFNVEEFDQGLPFDIDLAPPPTGAQPETAKRIVETYLRSLGPVDPDVLASALSSITSEGHRRSNTPPSYPVPRDVALAAARDWVAKEQGVDLLPTGEAQPRLPGEAGAVREENVATPQLEAPFALTPEAAKGPKGKQSLLFEQALFHGSPHDFDAFSSKYIGTGEGAQVYGYGLYFAENPAVAEGYHKQLIAASARFVDDSGVGIDEDTARRRIADRLVVNEALTKTGARMVADNVVDWRLEGLSEAAIDKQLATTLFSSDADIYRTALKLVDQYTITKPAGRVYTVDIPDDQIAKMLDWNKPLSEQPENVRKAFEQLHLPMREAWKESGAWEHVTGKTLYEDLADGTDRAHRGAVPYKDRQAAASRLLAETGVPGLRYLDQGSRQNVRLLRPDESVSGKWVVGQAPNGPNRFFDTEAEARAAMVAEEAKQTRNVVVFDDSIITLTHKDGTPVTSKERKDFFQSEQSGSVSSGQPERRGFIRFGPDRQVNIALLAKADLSTFLHETGHFFLEVFGDVVDQVSALPLEQLTDPQRKLLADYGAVLQHFGVANREDLKVEQHEEFARLFEAYLMEGKAPSLALRSAFARFRAWLLGVYRSLKGLNVQLTDDVRGIFDRMLATDAAITEAQQAGHVAPLFTTAESARMTEAQFSLYRTTVAKAARTARETLEQQVMAEVQREQTKQWQAQRAEIRTAVEADVYQRPVYRALAAIQKGTKADGTPLVEGMITPPMKLSRAILIEQYGADRLKTLPRPYVYTTTDGLDPNTVAELFGFSSGDELLTALSHAAPMKATIEQDTDAQMLAAHGSLLLDGTLHEKAQAAVTNDDREVVIRAELRALRQLQRTVAPVERAQRQQTRAGVAAIRASIPPAALLRDLARDRIGRTKTLEIRPSLFWSASRRASQQATEAAAKQDFDAAIVAKQQELMNVALYREAVRAKEDAATRVQQAKDLNTTKARQRLGRAGETYLDQVDGILDRYEFAKVSQKALERRARIRDWVEALEAQGLPTDDFTPEVLDDARRVNYQEITYDELVGITDGLKQIVHLARLKNKLLKSADQRDFTLARDGLVASIKALNPSKPTPLEFRAGDDRSRTVGDWFASHTKIAILARALDGHVDGGAAWEALIRPINAAADAEATRKLAEGEKYKTLLDTFYPKRERAGLRDKLFIPAINGSLSKEGRLAVALNWGNQTSRDRLLADPRRKWTPVQVQAILDTLDNRDWQFVQATWDYLNTFWDEIAAKQERVTGLKPDKVEALPVETRFGQFAGGYYPLAYDPRLNARAAQHEAATAAKLQTSAAYVRTTTKRGHVEARKQNVQLSVKLDLGVVFSHLEQVIHDLTHHEMLIDTTRLLRDRQVAAAIYETKGDVVYQQFTRALQDIAVGPAPATNVIERSANFARTGTQIALLGWNLWTGAQQPLGIFNGMSRVGSKWVARGMYRWLRDAATMEDTAGWITQVSPMMAARSRTATQDLSDLRQSLRQAGGWFDSLVRRVSLDTLTQQTIIDGFVWHIGLMQRVADIPTWLGGYEKAMAAGETEARAIALADQGVLDSQGGGQVKDLAQVQRGGPVARLYMTFYSYGSTVFNATADKAGATNFKSPAQVATFLGHLSLLYIMPAFGTIVLSRLLGRSGGDDDDETAFLADVGREVLSSALNTMVLARELTGLVSEGTRGYAGPAGARALELAYNLGGQVKQGDFDEGLAKASNQVAGVLFRYPAAQVQRTIDGIVALEEGRTSNPFAVLVGAPKAAK